MTFKPLSKNPGAVHDPTARAADAPLQVTRPSAMLCDCTRRRPESLPGWPISAAVCSPPLASQESIRRMGCGDVRLLRDDGRSGSGGKLRSTRLKLTKPRPVLLPNEAHLVSVAFGHPAPGSLVLYGKAPEPMQAKDDDSRGCRRRGRHRPRRLGSLCPFRPTLVISHAGNSVT